jgi:hypothetical protein
MATTRQVPLILEEIAEFLASTPSREQLLNYRPSEPVQRRARELLAKQGEEQLTKEEQQELDEFLQAEILMRLVKAKLHARKAARP